MTATAAAAAVLVWLAVMAGGRGAVRVPVRANRPRDDGAASSGLLARWRRSTPDTDLVARVSELAVLLRAGLNAAAAWEHACRDLGDDAVARRLGMAREQVRWGLSPVAALRGGPGTVVGPAVGESWTALRWHRRSSTRPDTCDSSGLDALAATWAVHERTGAPVADLLDTLVVGLSDARAATLARRAAMAAPLATARVLAGLPVLGLALGQLVGVRPVAVLLGTAPGRVSAAVGLVCAAAGVVWTRQLVRSAATRTRAR